MLQSLDRDRVYCLRSTIRPRGEYEFNGLFQRVVKRSDKDITDGTPGLDEQRLLYYSGAWQIVEERIDDGWTSGHTTDRIVQHVWGLRYIDDLVLNRQDSNVDGDYVDSSDFTHYALTDHQFSVVALIDSAGNLVERVSYTPYGEARHHWRQDVDGDGDIDATDQSLVHAALNKRIYESGYNVDADFDRNGIIDSNDSRQIGSGAFRAALPAGWISSLTTGNVIGFSGYVFNREIDAGGLYTVRFRHYDPVWGRWTSRDPAGYRDSMSLYGYGSGSALSTLDPFGLDDDDWGGLKGVLRRFFWGGNGGEGLSRRRQLESAGALDPIVPFDPLTEFYHKQMEVEAEMAAMIREMGAFYADIFTTALSLVAMHYGGGLVVRLLVKGAEVVAVLVDATGRIVGRIILGAAGAVIIIGEVTVAVVKHPATGKVAKPVGEGLLGYLGLREILGNNFGGESAPGLPGIPYDIYPHPFGWDCVGNNPQPGIY